MPRNNSGPRKYCVKIPNGGKKATRHNVMAANKRAAKKAVRNHLNLKRMPPHTEVCPVVEEEEEKLTTGQRMADLVATTMGSWKFIIIQSSILFCWIIFNAMLYLIDPWDPYPFILMNLMLSLQAAYAAPIIMMSRNRQEKRDRQALLQGLDVNKQNLVIDQQTNENIADIYIILLEYARKSDKQIKSLRKQLSTLKTQISELNENNKE